MQDRASTNQASMCKIKGVPIFASPPWKYFCYHALNIGMKLLPEKGNSTFSTKSRKLYHSIIQYKGKSRYLSGKFFGATVCDIPGVVLGVKTEKNDQIIRISCETIISQISQPLYSNKWSEASSRALLEEFGGEQNSAKIAMA